MITTIIIDDNKIIREHFQKVIDWESKGFKLLSVAANGIFGLQEFEKYHPQLVITDIKMPGMNGLELAQKIKQISPDVMIVFISNYEDFNYVKTAMDIGVYDYILKHETRGKLFDEKLERIKTEIANINSSKRHYTESIFFSALLTSDIQRLEQTFTGRHSIALLEQKSLLPPFAEATGTELNEVTKDELYSLVYSFTGKVVAVAKLQKYRYAILLEGCDDPVETVKALCKHLYDSMKTNFFALLLCTNGSANDCYLSYEKYKDMINYKFFLKFECLIEPENYLRFYDRDAKDTQLDTSGLFESINNMDVSKTYEALDSYAREIHQNCDYNGLCKLSAELITFFKNQESQVFSGFSNEDLNFWTNSDEIFFWLKSNLVHIINSMKKNPAVTYSPPVKTAIQYIRRNYMKNYLTVGEIADAVGMDTYHLNKLIKQESGLTTIKWLTNVRIDKAKQLLAEQKKITDVCSEVGYLNISYFSNVFKKMCGESPIDYRRKASNENTEN